MQAKTARILPATDADFEKDVLDSPTPVIVDFWADWCGPCHALSATVAELAREYEGSVKVMKLDVDQNQQTAATYGIRSIPTVLFFKGGEVVHALVGVHSKDRYKHVIDRVLAGE